MGPSTRAAATAAPAAAADSPGAREPLSRGRILACALTTIDRDGLEALSMRRLASELGVSAMSLYNHVPNKDALLEGVAERLLGEIDLAGVVAEPDWAAALKAGFRSFRRALLAHPHVVPLIENKPIATPATMRPVELSLALLRRAGFDPQGAMRAHWLLVGYTLGHVRFECTNPLSDAHGRGIAPGKTLPRDEFPHLHDSLPFAASNFDDAYEFGLDVIVAGLSERLAHAEWVGGAV